MSSQVPFPREVMDFDRPWAAQAGGATLGLSMLLALSFAAQPSDIWYFPLAVATFIVGAALLMYAV